MHACLPGLCCFVFEHLKAAQVDAVGRRVPDDSNRQPLEGASPPIHGKCIAHATHDACECGCRQDTVDLTMGSLFCAQLRATAEVDRLLYSTKINCTYACIRPRVAIQLGVSPECKVVGSGAGNRHIHRNRLSGDGAACGTRSSLSIHHAMPFQGHASNQ